MALGRMVADRRAVTAFFDLQATAGQAIADLAAAGVARGRITVVDGADAGHRAAVGNLLMADEDRDAYGEGLRRGGVLVSVLVAGDEARIVEILDREGAVDMDARQGDWDRAGWDPTPAPADRGGRPSPAPPVSTRPADEIRAAIAPVGAVGPAFATGEAGRAPRPGRGRALRDIEAEGLRLRTYVEARDSSGGAG